MIIKKMRASFGKLHEILELSEGMNLLTLPNEAGKSTWSAFLAAMLYGIDTSERANAVNQGLPAKERYLPWDGSAMEGSVELLWNGKSITIERTTKRRIPMGEFRAYETESGIPVPELTAENCGRMLCGVERSVFERTAFIRQLGLSVSGDAELEKRLNALVSTGEDGAKSYSELEALLKKRKNALSGRAGKIPELTAQIDDLQKAAESLAAMQDEVMTLNAKKEEAEREAARLEALQERIRLAQEAKKRAGLRDLEQKAAEQEALYRRLSDAAALLPKEERLRELRTELESAENELQTAKMEAAFGAEEPEKPNEPPYFAGLNGRQAKEKAEADRCEYERLTDITPPKKTLPLLLSLLAALLGLGLVIFGIVSESGLLLPIPGAVLLLGGVAALIVTLSVSGKKEAENRERLRQAELIPLRYGQSSIEGLSALAESYAAQQEDYLQRVMDRKAEKRRLAENMDRAQRKVQDCLTRVRAFAPDCYDTATCRDALFAALHTYTQLDGEKRTLDAMRAQCASMQTIFGAEQPKEDAEALLLDEAKIAYDCRRAKEELADLTTRLASQKGAISMKGDPVELSARLELLTDRLAAAQEQAEVTELAMEVLKKADDTLRSRFSPQITAEAGDLLSALTDGKYPKLLLKPDMSLSVREEGGAVLRSSAAMSCGTADQMYLALRLAMVHRLLPEDAPLLLDDALVNFDDKRAALALALLEKEAEKRQVIIFTCRRL